MASVLEGKFKIRGLYNPSTIQPFRSFGHICDFHFYNIEVNIILFVVITALIDCVSMY